jgi:GTP cyclohydrolase II
MSLKKIKVHGSGVVIYGFQEGRGIGLNNKIKAIQSEHSKGLDTVEAFKELGFAPDLREYDAMIAALNDLKISKDIYLITENPNKIKNLEKAGYRIKKILKLRIKVNRYNRKELLAKKNKLNYAIKIN